MTEKPFINEEKNHYNYHYNYIIFTVDFITSTVFVDKLNNMSSLLMA